MVSTLGKALTVVFTLSILALLFQLLYVLWRRRLFLRRNPTETTRPDHDQPDINAHSIYNSKHDLLYFLCLKSAALSRVKPAGDPLVGAANGSDDPVEAFDMVKLREKYGSGVLITIKEEEKEDLESLSWLTNKGNTTESFGDTALLPEFLVTINDEEVNEEEEEVISDIDEGEEEEVMNDMHEEEEEEEEEVMNDIHVEEEEVMNDIHVEEEEVNDVEVTPFSTPCASPLYFTPAGSPIHEILQPKIDVQWNRESVLL